MGIIIDFATGYAAAGGVMLFFALLCLFVLYLTAIGAEYINKPDGNIILKSIIGLILLIQTPAIVGLSIALLIIFCIALFTLYAKIF